MKTAFVPRLSHIKIPDFKYFTPLVWSGYDPAQQIALLRLLQACERLNIEVELGAIPLRLTPNHGGSTMKGWSFELPDFRIEYQTEAEWKREAERAFKQESERFLEWCRTRVNEMLSSGAIVPAKRTRKGGKIAPINLRYEWAARRYILNEDYKTIASEKYNVGQIKQAVLDILNEAGLAEK